MSRVNPGRIAAVRALIEIDVGAFADEALAKFLPKHPPDRGLARHLAFGLLRKRGEVDGALRLVLRQPISALEPPVRAILRIGAYEKLFSRTREHAVVHQTVELCRALKVARAKGLVNAVMRRVKPNAKLTRGERLNHPEWLIERWEERHGAEAAQAWCRGNNETPCLYVVGHGEFSPAVFEPAGIEASEVAIGGQVLDRVCRLDGHNGLVSDLPGFSDGQYWVQDAAAVCMADLMGDVNGKRVLDACAAPGGKSFRLVANGAQVVAADISKSRLERLTENALRLGLRVETMIHDWEAAPADMGLDFDAVLVDAPCTGLGVVRRRPEIRWRRQESDLTSMSLRQERILAHCAIHVRSGGNLVYSVCSPEPVEGRDRVAAFLASHPDFTLQHTVETAPPQGGEDAHFGALMKRR